MPRWIPVFKGVISHINIQIQAINRPCWIGADGALKSSTKLYYDNDPCYLEVHKEIEALRDSIKVHVADIEKKHCWNSS
jgi:hypothetical protein